MKIKSFIFLCILVIYTSIYLMINMGYYEYANYKKKELTEEQIKKFENDVKNGYNIDITSYIENNDDFNLVLEECLANYFALFGEYDRLLCNIQDFIDGGHPVEGYDKLIEVREAMNNIITAINLSTWKNLSCCKALS